MYLQMKEPKVCQDLVNISRQANRAMASWKVDVSPTIRNTEFTLYTALCRKHKARMEGMMSRERYRGSFG